MHHGQRIAAQGFGREDIELVEAALHARASMAASSTRPSADTACSINEGATVTKLSRSVLQRGVLAVERRAGHIGHARGHGLRQQRRGIQALGQLDPEEHAAGRHGEATARRQVLVERGAHRIALRLVACAHGRQVSVEQTGADDLVGHALVEAGRVQVGRLLGLQQLRVQRARRHHVAQPQPRRQHLGEGAEVDAALARRGTHGRRRRCVVPQLAIGVVFDQRQSGTGSRLHQLEPARASHAAPAGVLEIGQQVQEARAGRGRQRLRQRALLVAIDGHEVRLVGREGLQRAEIGGRFHRHFRRRRRSAACPPGPAPAASRW